MTIMNINGLFAEIHTPDALRGESLHMLPPYAARPAYSVDEYQACPENWMHGSGLSSSYFVPVSVGKGMWFNFTMNQSHNHDVAVVISVQGVNPLTGPINPGKVAELRLEQYKHKCPRHDCDFQQDRYCPKCEYKWPAQNYLATTTGLPLWIDGFRNEKGEVRQYLITDDVAKGVAAQLIGDNRVFAIGFAFYESVNPKPKKEYNFGGSFYQPSYTWGGSIPPKTWLDCSDNLDDTYGSLGKSGPNTVFGFNSVQVSCQSGGHSMSCTPPTTQPPIAQPSGRGVLRTASLAPVKTLEIGAGARINQEVGIDTNDISYWKSEPTGMIYVNYVSEEECSQIINAGRRQDKKDGAFANLNLAH